MEGGRERERAEQLRHQHQHHRFLARLCYPTTPIDSACTSTSRCCITTPGRPVDAKHYPPGLHSDYLHLQPLPSPGVWSYSPPSQLAALRALPGPALALPVPRHSHPRPRPSACDKKRPLLVPLLLAASPTPRNKASACAYILDPPQALILHVAG